MDTKEIKLMEDELTKQLEKMRDQVMCIYEKAVEDDGLNRSKELLSMHALIGSKNNTFVDSVRMQFMDPNDFIARWLKGLIDKYGDKEYTKADGGKYKYILIELIKNVTFRKYVYTFLTRNFYRNLQARIRVKPDEQLWELWFGGGSFVLGLLITPVYRADKWVNDVSEIRRTDYKYWTIGHVMSVGFVDPEATKKIMFHSYEDLFTFYRSILKKLSSSQYEKEIFEKYIVYLEESDNINEEPLLIPEIRYAGVQRKHLYRMDFTVLNIYTQEYIGFELSPSSSHMSIHGIKSGKTQGQMNEELADKWTKEMNKRNNYFSTFGIHTITFTDEHLEDIDNVFATIKSFLAKRNTEETSISNEIARLEALG